MRTKLAAVSLVLALLAAGISTCAAEPAPQAGEAYSFAEPHLCGIIDFPRGDVAAEIARCAQAFCQSHGLSKASSIESGETILSASKGSGKTQPYLSKVTCSD
jgi:hypothetical protein